MNLAAYASETNKLTLAITHTSGLFIIHESSEVFVEHVLLVAGIQSSAQAKKPRALYSGL